MNKLVTLLTFVVVCASASAQTVGTVKGKLMDSSATKQSLKDATVTVLTTDSTLEVFGLAKSDGSFSITNISFGDKLLQVSFNGYEPVFRKLSFTKNNAILDLGNLYLQQASNDLGNVTVKQSVVQMKKDTVEFAASGFATKPNAVAEDLLKKIPGMEVGKDGSIKSGGEAVSRILVNGKRFFGDDPKLATRTLPPDLIDKIQVFDDQSDQSKFSGFDDGNRVKTINITTKKDVRKGYFGKVRAGGGIMTGEPPISGGDAVTEGLHDVGFDFSRMNGDEQITVKGQANDVNKQDFTQQNLFSGGVRGGGGFGGAGRGGGFTGGGGGGGSSSGITNTLAGGINYRNTWGKNTDVYGSYFYSQPHVLVERKSNIQTIITPDSSNYNNQVSSSISQDYSHRFNLNIESRIDTNNSLIFRPNFGFQRSTPTSTSATVTTDGKGNKIAETVNKTSSNTNGYNLNNTNLTFRHRFKKKFRTISLDLNFSASENKGDGRNYAINNFYAPFAKVDTLNQYTVDTSRSFSINPTVSYTEPLSANQVLEFRYSYGYTDNNSINNTYKFDNSSGKFSTFDSLFSNSYQYNSTTSNAQLSWRIQNAKFNLSIGGGLQTNGIYSNNTTKNVIVDKDYTYFTPNVNFNYNFTRTKSLRAFYNGRPGLPSTAQLQPILTTSDQRNYQLGNSNLKPQYTHSLRVLYTSFDPVTQNMIFATVNGSMVQDDIQTSVVQSDNSNKLTTYVNLGGTYNITGTFIYGFPIKSPKSNLNLNTNLGWSQSQSLLTNKFVGTNVSSYSRSTDISETVKWTTNLKKNFDMNLSATFRFNPVRNTLNPEQNTNYTTQTLAADFTLYSNNGWLIASDFDYTHYGNRAPGYNTTAFVVTPSIAKQFLKNKAGEFRLTCFDIFKQNTAVSSSISGTQYTNTQTNVLTRYFMLTFTYNLRSFFGQQNQQRNNMMPGMNRGNFQGNFPGGNFNGGGNFGGGGNRRG
jgi:hypothetical protein